MPWQQRDARNHCRSPTDRLEVNNIESDGAEPPPPEIMRPCLFDLLIKTVFHSAFTWLPRFSALGISGQLPAEPPISRIIEVRRLATPSRSGVFQSAIFGNYVLRYNSESLGGEPHARFRSPGRDRPYRRPTIWQPWQDRIALVGVRLHIRPAGVEICVVNEAARLSMRPKIACATDVPSRRRRWFWDSVVEHVVGKLQT